MKQVQKHKTLADVQHTDKDNNTHTDLYILGRTGYKGPGNTNRSGPDNYCGGKKSKDKSETS